MSTQFDASEILAAVEEHISALPTTRRRRPADDGAAEDENYGAAPVADDSIRLELSHEQQVDLHLLLWLLADTKGPGQVGIMRQIRSLLGLTGDSPARREARRAYGKGGAA